MRFVAFRPCLRLGLLVIALMFVSARAASAAPNYVYVLNQVNGAANQIYGFQIDSTTGALTLIPGFPVASGGLGGSGSFSEHLAFAGGRLFVLNELSASMSVFSVNAFTGALTAMPYSPIALSGDLACVAPNPTGTIAFVGSNAGAWSILLTPTTATITAGSPVATTGASPFSCAFSADSYAYTGGNVGTTIAAFSVNPATGVLSTLAGSPKDTLAGNPVGYATDAAGRFFTSNFGGGLRAFTRASGVLTAVSGNPFPSGLAGGVQSVVHPAGFLMVADRSANRVGVYQISGSGSGTTLTAVAGSPFASGGSFTDALAVSRDGKFLVAAHGVSRNLTTWQVNPTTGVLSSQVVSPPDSAGAGGLLTGVAFANFSDAVGDFDGDSSADISVFRPSTGQWATLSSSSGFSTLTIRLFGISTDKTVPGDYDGDGKVDNAIFRPSTGAWWVLKSSSNYMQSSTTPWGVASDKLVPADYDGDGATDPAVFRPSTGQWWILKSSTAYATFSTVSWGVSTDVPVPADFDGDRKADLVVYRPSAGQWWVLFSSSNYTSFAMHAWGAPSDVAVPGDYDGDGKTDLAVYRPSSGQWFLKFSATNYQTFTVVAWGAVGDVPVPGDFDGDRKTDHAVFRPSTGQWWVQRSSTGAFFVANLGSSTDTPILKRPSP